ncbi:radical SAM protein [Patescibacteria group bacterium]
MKIREIQASSIITKSNLPDADFVVNPYVGCMHCCVYCYAVFMKRFTGHGDEDWGSFVDVKVNAADLVPEKSEKYKGKLIFISSVTDAYMPIERKYQLTRKVLEKLVNLQPRLGVHTKSDLVLRDIDVLKKFLDCEVGITITTLNDEIRKEIEPLASSVERRVKALEELKKEGIRNYVFVGPILPFLTDWKEIVLKTKHCTDLYMFESLNVKGLMWQGVKKWLQERHPELVCEYEKIYFSKNDFWSDMKKEIEEFCEEQCVECRIYFDHGK